MAKINDGGAAFPSEQPHILIPGDMPEEWRSKIAQIAYQSKGMTLRQWYAGMALQGFCANPVLTAAMAEVTKDPSVAIEALTKMAETAAEIMLSHPEPEDKRA